MKILYCRVGWMKSYHGSTLEKPRGGGKYNEKNIGHEVYNFLCYKGKYYGFVEAGINKSIHVERLCENKTEFAENVTVVWVAKKPEGGQFIVGWYENARIYRTPQKVPVEVMQVRKLKNHNFYNIYSENVLLIKTNEREYRVSGMGHSNIWYGKPEENEKVLKYIRDYKKEYDNRIEKIEKKLSDVVGSDRETLVKVRINQDKFRNGLIEKYGGKCCLCGMNHLSMLVASHIKPWSKSDKNEKLDIENGLLLCPNHDKLFDAGLISFDLNGEIIISNQLSEHNQNIMNVNKNLKIKITDDNREYIKYHRDNIFVE